MSCFSQFFFPVYFSRLTDKSLCSCVKYWKQRSFCCTVEGGVCVCVCVCVGVGVGVCVGVGVGCCSMSD